MQFSDIPPGAGYVIETTGVVVTVALSVVCIRLGRSLVGRITNATCRRQSGRSIFCEAEAEAGTVTHH